MAWSATDESRRMLMARIGLFYLFIIIVSCLSILPSSSAKTQVKKKYNSFFFFSFFLQSLDYAQQSTLVTRSDNGVNSWAGGFQDGFSSPTALATANKSKDKTRFLKKRKEKKRKDYSDRRHDKTNDMIGSVLPGQPRAGHDVLYSFMKPIDRQVGSVRPVGNQGEKKEQSNELALPPPPPLDWMLNTLASFYRFLWFEISI